MKVILRTLLALLVVACVYLNSQALDLRFPGVDLSGRLIDAVFIAGPIIAYLIVIRNGRLFWIGLLATFFICIHQIYWALQWYNEAKEYPGTYGPGSGLGPAISLIYILPLLIFLASVAGFTAFKMVCSSIRSKLHAEPDAQS